jgi:CopG family transcriptional regulator / antitoxin EndoAI
MNTENVRINITLPKELLHILDEISGPRKRSSFIAEAIQLKVKATKEAELEKQLTEGYRACAKESLEIANEFEPADFEGWDD